MTFILTTIIRSLIRRLPGIRLFTGIFVAAVASAIFLFILYAAGLFRIARNRSIRFPYLAWVPILSMYVLGACADDESGKRRYAIACPAFLAGAVALFAFAYAPGSDVLGAPLGLVLAAFALLIIDAVLFFLALRDVYASISRAPTLLTVLSILFWVLIPIFIFAMRDNLPGGGKRLTIDPAGD